MKRSSGKPTPTVDDVAECLACGDATLHTESFDEVVAHRNIQVDVSGLVRTVCGNCGCEWVNPAQHDQNLKLVRSVYREEIEAHRRSRGLLTGQEIRLIREGLGLTQREAALVFGGGANAFSKYENQEVIQAKPMDVLLRVAAHIGIHELKRALKHGGTGTWEFNPSAPSNKWIPKTFSFTELLDQYTENIRALTRPPRETTPRSSKAPAKRRVRRGAKSA